MLKLININKSYLKGENEFYALKNINIEFRKNEFVSVLGESGSGKTTLLNIIGGLDNYTSGDIIIENISTKNYKDANWDNYRNNRVGFIFQSYNLIPPLSVLENVELALTLSGISKAERKERAKNVLKEVGLENKLNSKPSQLSGGQMQRVAIARALINDPEIILADEPTGALDSVTSVQIMELLKKISKNKLIIMVTHNPTLAKKYSTRLIKLSDGKIIEDSKPYKTRAKKTNNSKTNKKKKMNFFTALSLSGKNLQTKKRRTLIVSFAGAIGIIGIALVLAISNGFSNFSASLQKEALSSYPISITNSNYDMASLIKTLVKPDTESYNTSDLVYTKHDLTGMLTEFSATTNSSDLKSFKNYLENEGKDEISKYTSSIQYGYDINLNAYFKNSLGEVVEAYSDKLFSDILTEYPKSHPDFIASADKKTRFNILNFIVSSTGGYYANGYWNEMFDNLDVLNEKYEIKNGRYATEFNEVNLVLNNNNEISDFALFALGLLTKDELNQVMDNYINGKTLNQVASTFNFDEMLNLEYRIILESDYFEKQLNNTYIDIREYKETNEELYKQKIQNLYVTKAIPVKVVGIVKEKEASLSPTMPIMYTKNLTEYIITKNNDSEIIKAQLNTNITNIISNTTFSVDNFEREKAEILATLKYTDFSTPSEINLYPINFEAKKKINKFISNYNNLMLNNGEEEKIVTFSDGVGSMVSSVSTIINAITYILVAFIGVSLIVSSIMVGIITYISVLERTKEIGVLRSVGASKKDISRVFTAESFIIGLSSGLIGIFLALILIIPINIILKTYTGLVNMASLPASFAIILILISIGLTLIAGFIPAKIAAKKDPVIALRENN